MPKNVRSDSGRSIDRAAKDKAGYEPLRFLVVGGGSGGHVSPLRAISRELFNKTVQEGYDPEIIFISERGGNFSELMNIEEVDSHKEIFAGKFRRYHGESFLGHIKDYKTVALNIRDFFKFSAGTAEAFVLLKRLKPDAIFLKGGFVSVPIGWAAGVLGIPYFTHDSDSIPGLANRLTAKKATKNLTALPTENYPYPDKKSLHTGVPILEDFFDIDSESQIKAKEELRIPLSKTTIFVTGGGLGAESMNKNFVQSLQNIKAKHKEVFESLQIVHLTGKGPYQQTLELYQNKRLIDEKSRNIKVMDFTTEVLKYTDAADIIITRAGATALAEFSAAAKPCIVVPNPVLTGGQQTHNAEIIRNSSAGIIINEGSSSEMVDAILTLFNSPKKRRELGENFRKLAVKGSASKIAELMYKAAKSYSSKDINQKTKVS